MISYLLLFEICRQSYCNQVYFVSTSKTKKEPKKIVIRKYGGNLAGDTSSLKPLTTAQELVLLTELFSRNLSAKLYGFFDGGRIEEFVDSHIMTEEESYTESYERDFAINLARFNAVDAPLPKPGYDFRVVLRDRTNASKENFEKFLTEPESSMVHEAARHDWDAELDWLCTLLKPEYHRMVLMHWDAHLSNIGVRHNKESSDISTILFDYELSNYNMRGKDVGLFLLSRVEMIGGKNTREFTSREECMFPEPEKCRSFVEAYMKECSILFDDWDESGKDSFDHIMMEAIIGGMVSCISFMMPSGPIEEKDENKQHKVFFNRFVQKLFWFYEGCKDRLLKSYPNHLQQL